MAGIVQLRNDTPGRAYYRRRVAEGKTSMEAMRCLRRRLSDVVYRQLAADAGHKHRPGGPGRALRGDSIVQRGRPSPGHRHFGPATSRTRTQDATPATSCAQDPRGPRRRHPATARPRCQRGAPHRDLAHIS